MTSEIKFCILTFALLTVAITMCLFGIMYALFAILAHLQRCDSDFDCEVNGNGK